jgi:predicted amidohydrolase YtcJ
MGSYWFRNGSVYTMDPRRPWAESVVVHDEVIAFVGADADAGAYRRGDTVEVDLEGGFLMPGFISGHDHFIGGALSKIGVSLENLHGKDDVLQKIRQYAEAHPHKDVIRGHGWTQFTFDGVQPHRTWLDTVTDTRPAFIHSYEVHDVWANTAAFVAAGIDANTPDPNPPASFFFRDSDGYPAGTCCEGSWLPLAIQLGMYSIDSIREAMDLTMTPAPARGLTTYFDAGTLLDSRAKDREIHDELMQLDKDGKLPVRIVASSGFVRGTKKDPARIIEDALEMQSRVTSPNISVTTVKMFMDGVGPAHTASMLEPYLDEPHTGGWVTPPDFAKEVAEAGNLAGFDVHIHACGDAAVRAGLDAFEHVRTKHPGLTPRNTVCHLEFCHPDDVPRFAELDVTANATPLWGTDYLGEFVDAYPKLVGEERFRRDYLPYGSIVSTGARVTMGSDCPGVGVDEIAPLIHIEAAVTRRRPGRPDDRPAGGHEQMSLADALKCFTINGAKALRLEDITGSIEVGKRADFVHLAHNPFNVQHHEIHAIPILHTMLGGRFTFG